MSSSEPTPTTDTPTPSSSPDPGAEPASSVASTAPAADAPTPAADAPTPAVDAPAPAVDAPAPKADAPAPKADAAAPPSTTPQPQPKAEEEAAPEPAKNKKGKTNEQQPGLQGLGPPTAPAQKKDGGLDPMSQLCKDLNDEFVSKVNTMVTDKTKGAVKDLWQGFKNTESGKALTEAASSVTNAAKNKWDSLANSDKVQNMTQGLKDAKSAAQSKMGEALDKVDQLIANGIRDQLLPSNDKKPEATFFTPDQKNASPAAQQPTASAATADVPPTFEDDGLDDDDDELNAQVDMAKDDSAAASPSTLDLSSPPDSPTVSSSLLRSMDALAEDELTTEASPTPREEEELENTDSAAPTRP